MYLLDALNAQVNPPPITGSPPGSTIREPVPLSMIRRPGQPRPGPLHGDGPNSRGYETCLRRNTRPCRPLPHVSSHLLALLPCRTPPSPADVHETRLRGVWEGSDPRECEWVWWAGPTSGRLPLPFSHQSVQPHERFLHNGPRGRTHWGGLDITNCDVTEQNEDSVRGGQGSLCDPRTQQPMAVKNGQNPRGTRLGDPYAGDKRP